MELQLQDLRKQYKEKCAVDNVSATLMPGVYGLLGANGAGKTTLMRMICGVLKPTAGSIRLSGKTIEELGDIIPIWDICRRILVFILILRHVNLCCIWLR